MRTVDIAAASAPSKTTPLHAEHVRLGARMAGFGGWEMPIQYGGIVEEHRAVRTAVGMFDISHMGELVARCSAAELNALLTNDVRQLAAGEGHYTMLLNEKGGVIDDLIVYRLGEMEFLLVVNASMIEHDYGWIDVNWKAELENRSNAFAAIAVQGPGARAVLAGWLPTPEKNRIEKSADVLVAGTGYTGEEGWELFFPSERAVEVWQALLERGVKPCGLGARDTLRLEMGYPLNGSDLSPEHTPLEAGLGFFVSFDKGDFIGREALLEQKANGLTRKLVAFKMNGPSPPPRPHYAIYSGVEKIGEVGSGTLSPSLNAGIGMAYLPVAHAVLNEEIDIDIRGRRFKATVTRKPFHRKPTL